MNNYALEIAGLTKKFEEFTLSDVTFNIEKGSIMGFIGENGAGKTTTIKLILNAIGRDAGDIKVFGMDNIEKEREVKARIGYIADSDYLYVGSTLEGHANAYSKVYDNWDEELFHKYVNLWGLSLNQKCINLSKGTKTKAMLALTLAHKPDLLVLDEPTAGLDPVARIEVLDILREFVDDGEKAVLISTHITSDLDKIADYISIIIDGKITESMALDKIEEKYAVISGSSDDLVNKENLLVGVRKGSMTFEGLVLRESLDRFPDVIVHTPNIENLLTFSIWGNR